MAEDVITWNLVLKNLSKQTPKILGHDLHHKGVERAHMK